MYTETLSVFQYNFTFAFKLIYFKKITAIYFGITVHVSRSKYSLYNIRVYCDAIKGHDVGMLTILQNIQESRTKLFIYVDYVLGNQFYNKIVLSETTVFRICF